MNRRLVSTPRGQELWTVKAQGKCVRLWRMQPRFFLIKKGKKDILGISVSWFTLPDVHN